MSICSFFGRDHGGGEFPPGFSPLAMIPITPNGNKTEKEITP